MSTESRYQVFNSGAIAEQFRTILDQARGEGRFRQVFAAAKWIIEELERTPREFGESREDRPGMSLILRCGFARPLFVEYAIHEASRTVFIRKFVLLRS